MGKGWDNGCIVFNDAYLISISYSLSIHQITFINACKTTLYHIKIHEMKVEELKSSDVIKQVYKLENRQTNKQKQREIRNGQDFR